MKIKYFPHLDNTQAPWWVGIVVRNVSDYDQLARVVFNDYEMDIYLKIYPGKFNVIAPENIPVGIYSVTLWLPDGCTEQIHQGSLDAQGVQTLTNAYLNHEELTTLQEIIRPIGSGGIENLTQGYTFNFNGKQECSYIYTDVKRILAFLAWQMYSLWPDRNDRKINIGDSGSLTTCSGHSGAHDGLKAGDFDYLTHKTNITQYGKKTTSIWREGEITDVFDSERTAWWWERLSKIFPRGQVISHSKIIAVVKKNHPDLYEEIKDYLQVYDGGMHAFHWHHTHDRQTDGYPEINKGSVLI